jgi:Domain of unknown function DUF29
VTMPDYDADFYGWTQAQAAAIRARAWDVLDIEHVAEEIEDLWKHDEHQLTMLILGFLELIYRPRADACLTSRWSGTHSSSIPALSAIRARTSRLQNAYMLICKVRGCAAGLLRMTSKEVESSTSKSMKPYSSTKVCC